MKSHTFCYSKFKKSKLKVFSKNSIDQYQFVNSQWGYSVFPYATINTFYVKMRIFKGYQFVYRLSK